MIRAGAVEARPYLPTVMRGISHKKIEDTTEEHIEMSVKALDRLASETINWISASGK